MALTGQVQDEQQQQQKKRKKLALLSSFEASLPREEHTFSEPAVVPDALREAYEEHRKEMAKKMGYYGPWVPPNLPWEDEMVFSNNSRLSKRDLRNPRKNPNMMPEKDIAIEKW